MTELHAHVSGGHAVVGRFELRVASGQDAGAVFSSSGERVLVGTHESATLVVHDATVSRFHVAIEVAGGKVVATDQGSRNGTFVEGVSIEKAHLHDGALITIGRTQIKLTLMKEAAHIRLSTRERFGVALGASPAIRRVFAVLERAATSDATVLLEGETGTGKEIIAESIHMESGRRDGPFIVVDCSAIPRDLLESELFGHERGAFSGAVAAREGAFEAANGGTLFLDEIGELSPDLQPKLLRVLERREVKRVGSNRYTKIDLRIIAATNRNLRTDVNEGKFRSDVYYRLAVVEVSLPPLRERIDDVPMLVEHMLEDLGVSARPEADILRSPEMLAQLRRHTWPGNIRELRNYVERCVALQESAPIAPQHGAQGGGAQREDAAGAAEVDIGSPLKEARERCVQAFERRYLAALLAREGGNVAAAARAAKLDRPYFYRLLWHHGLK